MDFQGQLAENLSLLSTVSNTVTAGNEVHSPRLDVRNFNSYYLVVQADNVGAATQFNEVYIYLTWYSDPTSTTPMTFGDTYSFWAGSVTPNWIVQPNSLSIQDSNHGPYLYVDIFNAGASDVNISSYLYGSSRVLPAPYVAQPYSEGFLAKFLANGITTGSTVHLPFRLGYGPNETRMHNYSINTMTFTYYAGSNPNPLEVITVPANTLTIRNFIFPKVAMRCDLYNNDGFTTFDLTCITEYTKQ
jgi:hypothetical protein